MPGQKISTLAPVSNLQPTDQFVLARSGSTYKITGDKLGGSVYSSDTAPSSPTSGQLWFNTSNGITYIYYSDGNSSQWVDVGGGDSITSLNVANSPTVGLSYNALTRTLSANATISVVDSPTIDLSYNTSTGTLSAVTTSFVATSSSPMVAKAWVVFDGFTGGVATIKDSYRISSVTRNSTGAYSINFIAGTFNNALYSYHGTCRDDGTRASWVHTYSSGTKTSSSCQIVVSYPLGAQSTIVQDSAEICVVFFSN